VSQNGQDNKCLHSSQNKIIIHLTVVVNMTKFAQISAMKKMAEKGNMVRTSRCEKKKQIQRGDMFEKYKHNLMGIKEQLN
jgi:hypothetical protein